MDSGSQAAVSFAEAAKDGNEVFDGAVVVDDKDERRAAAR